MIAGSVACTIERRLLVNYRIDPEFVAPLLPRPFRPQLVAGRAVGGVCFLRLGGLRAGLMPGMPGFATENAAHRFAVEWDDAGGTRVGVYVPRRDTSSRITAVAGGKIFPGSYHLARFAVDEPGDDVRIAVTSNDRNVRLTVAAVPAATLDSQLFPALPDAVDFFRRGALGFSPSGHSGSLDGVRLHSASWDAHPMAVEHIGSSLFDETTVFPRGTCLLDFALVMRNIRARWTSEPARSGASGPTRGAGDDGGRPGF
jgi:Uncharacterized conserved protein (COG2071)